MNSLRLRVALWFAVSVAAVMAVFVAVTFFHLQRELRVEAAEQPDPAWVLHGTYTDAEVSDIVAELWSFSVVYAGPMVLLAMAVGYFVARRAFRPVEEMNRQLQRIDAANLGARLDLTGADREFHAIGAAINGLLVRLEDSFRALADFSGQVAHELRTPLTLMRLQIEESAGRIEPALAESMQDELKRLSDYVEQCLLLATAEQGRLTVHRERVALGALVADVIEAYTLLARAEQRLIRFAAADADVLTDPRHFRQLLHILLSNALRHGDGAINVAIGRGKDGSVTCEVVNRMGPVRAGGSGLGLRVGRALAATLGIGLETRAEAEQTFRARVRFDVSVVVGPPVAATTPPG